MALYIQLTNETGQHSLWDQWIYYAYSTLYIYIYIHTHTHIYIYIYIYIYMEFCFIYIYRIAYFTHKVKI